MHDLDHCLHCRFGGRRELKKQEGKAQHKKLEKIHLSGGAKAKLNFSHFCPSFCLSFLCHVTLTNFRV